MRLSNLIKTTKQINPKGDVMKMFTLVCILAAASIATAQTAATNGGPGVDNAKPEIKKVTKKTKKSVTPDEKVTETKKTVSDADEVKTTTTTVIKDTAAGTSETVITGTVAPQPKNWSAAIATDVWVNTQAANTQKEKADLGSENYIGASYKVTTDTAVGFRQYFDYNRVAGAPAGENGLNGLYTSYLSLNLMPRFGGILGSKDIKPNFFFFLPTRQGAEHFERDNGITAARNAGLTTEELKFNGYLRADAELAYELAPMFTAAYTVSLRQFLFPEQNIAGVPFEDLTRYIHMATMYMNVNDFVTPYAYVGMDHRWITADSTLQREDFIAAIGTTFTYGALSITPEVNNRTVLKRNFTQNSEARAFDANDLYYELYTTVSF